MSGPDPEQEAAGLLFAASTGSGAAQGGGARGRGLKLMVQLRALNAALGTPGIYLPALFLFAWTVRIVAGTGPHTQPLPCTVTGCSAPLA